MNNFKQYEKWINKIIKLDDTKVEKYIFHQIIISFGKKDFKYFNDNKDAEKQTFMDIPSKNECIYKRF